MRNIVYFLFSPIIFILSSYAEITEITNKEGVTIRVELINFKDSVLDCRNLSNNKVYKLPLDKLNEESQKNVEKWVEEGGNYSRKYKIKFEKNSSTKSSKNSYYHYDYGSYYDEEDRLERINSQVIVSNDDIRGKATAPTTLVVVTFSTPIVYPDNVKIIENKTFKVPSIEAGNSQQFAMSPVQLEYDKTGYVHGHKFKGYAIYLLDDKKKIIHKEYSSRTIEKKFGERLLKSKENSTLVPH